MPILLVRVVQSIKKLTLRTLVINARPNLVLRRKVYAHFRMLRHVLVESARRSRYPGESAPLLGQCFGGIVFVTTARSQYRCNSNT